MKRVYDDLRSQFTKFTEILDKEITGDAREAVAQALFDQIPDNAEFEDLPLQKISNSENVGGVRLTRNNSRKFGEVPGFETCAPKQMNKQKAIKLLPKLMYKFMHIEKPV